MSSTTATIECSSMNEAAAAMRRLRFVRGLDSIVFNIGGAPSHRVDRNGAPGEWRTLIAGRAGWVPLEALVA